MESADSMTHVLASSISILYRIQRVTADSTRFVRVKIVDLDPAIPDDQRLHGPDVIKFLSKLDAWNGPWKTLRVHEEGGKRRTWCETDVEPAPAVPSGILLDTYPRLDLASLDVKHAIIPTNRAVQATVDGQVCYVKTAHFRHEMRYLATELQAYHALEGCPRTPKLLTYLYEETPERVVGFLVEKLDGRHAEAEDLALCLGALDELHNYIIHGDLNKYNIIITENGPMFIDFEVSIPIGSEAWTAEVRDKERTGLEAKLADTSGIGGPPRSVSKPPNIHFGSALSAAVLTEAEDKNENGAMAQV